MNLNPFDLRGPEFLVFYVALLVVTAIVARMFRRLSLEPGGSAEKSAIWPSRLPRIPTRSPTCGAAARNCSAWRSCR